MKRAAVLVLMVFTLSVLADGPLMKDGRFSGGPVTILTLQSDQEPEKPTSGWEITLTQDQRAKLKHESGYSPKTLFVWNTKDGYMDCACDASDWAFWFEDGKVEVPHLYLLPLEEGEGCG